MENDEHHPALLGHFCIRGTIYKCSDLLTYWSGLLFVFFYFQNYFTFLLYNYISNSIIILCTVNSTMLSNYVLYQYF